ncbi:hypothetical protein [Pseudomonas sp. TTU2014-080ASC]|uniref:hypothetical protein n=1 Tax=Pseudomonas sp. TTU2014-080ASC TaxID=1729724 RepID=UPI000A491392|nr:hypothetical protein [Pseudomonas sp. TTU2014-080ASC]
MSHEYEPGQVWEYKTRLKEPASTVTILKIEHYDDLGDVVHISLNDIKITNPLKGNVVTSVPRMPFIQSALDASVTRLKTETAVPDFEEGYNA